MPALLNRRDAEAGVRLLLLVEYSDDEIIDALVKQYDVTSDEACGILRQAKSSTEGV